MVFGRLGIVGFGGPAAHIALMREELVRRRGWLDDAAFLDLVGISNLLPGPTSTEVALHLGHRRAGLRGLLVAGFAFIAPAVILVALAAWAYVTYGTMPEVGAVLAGIAPVVVAIVAWAAVWLGRTALHSGLTVAIGLAAVIGAMAGVSEFALILGLGLLALVVAEVRDGGRSPAAAGLFAAAGVATAGVAPLAIFLEFVKIGSLVFGSGYVLVTYLQTELVDGLGWITEQQLLDAVAVGQLTPGPIFSTATFVGYLVGGPVGAAAATIGVFLPAFVFVAASVRMLDRLRTSRRARAFLDGVNAAAVGVLATTAARLGDSAIVDPITAAIALVAAVLLLIGRVGPVALILAGGAAGLIRVALTG